MYYSHLSRLVPGPLSWYAAALIWKAFPLDMSQYDRLFNSTRVPEIGKDCLLSFKNEAPKHLVVMRSGQFYSIDVVQEDGNLGLSALSMRLLYLSTMLKSPYCLAYGCHWPTPCTIGGANDIHGGSVIYTS